jgi:hypothetical protein
MDSAGADHLYTLSILTITFATISALVTIVRQIKGGQLSMVDVHLLTTFVSAGFAQCLAAILPPALGLFGLSGRPLWGMASGASAVLFAAVIARIQWERSKFATLGLGSSAIVAFVGLWFSVLILIFNAIVPSIQGTGPHAAAITVSLGTVMWSFVHRLASLGSQSSDGDWDLRRG